MAAVASFEAGVHSNAAGTALSALSEAAFSGSVDEVHPDSQAQSYGGNSPVHPPAETVTSVASGTALSTKYLTYISRRWQQEARFQRRSRLKGPGQLRPQLLRHVPVVKRAHFRPLQKEKVPSSAKRDAVPLDVVWECSSAVHMLPSFQRMVQQMEILCRSRLSCVGSTLVQNSAAHQSSHSKSLPDEQICSTSHRADRRSWP